MSGERAKRVPTESLVYSDSEAIKRVLDGDCNAYAAIIFRYQREIYALCSCLLREPEETEGLVQHVFVRGFTDLRKFSGFILGPWLKTIARNLVREELVRQFREPGPLQPYFQYLYERMEDEVSDDEEVTRWQNGIEEVRQDLEETAAAIVDARFYRGVTPDQIADEMGIGVGSVQRILRESRVELRDRILGRNPGK